MQGPAFVHVTSRKRLAEDVSQVLSIDNPHWGVSAYGLRIVFRLVFPYVWGWKAIFDSRDQALCTYKALSATCRQLWVYQWLRRRIAMSRSLNMSYLEWVGKFGAYNGLIEKRRLRKTSTITWQNSPTILQNNRPVLQGPGLTCAFAQVVFPHVARGCGARLDGTKYFITAFIARDFAELVLFCNQVYEAEMSMKKGGEYSPYVDLTDTYICLPAWRVPEEGSIFGGIWFTRGNMTKYFASDILGRMRRIGSTAPIDFAFTSGAIQNTAYSWFLDVCGTSGTRKPGTPQDKLKAFVAGWFPNDPWTSGGPALLPRAFKTEMQFEL